MSIGPDALGSKTEASTVRWVPPVTRGTSSAAPGVVAAINANGTVAATAGRRVGVRMVAPRKGWSVGRWVERALAGGGGSGTAAALWYVANMAPRGAVAAYGAV